MTNAQNENSRNLYHCDTCHTVFFDKNTDGKVPLDCHVCDTMTSASRITEEEL